MTKNIHKSRILVLDFGSQYTQLIVRRVREIGVYCASWSWNITEEQIKIFNPSGIILSGSPENSSKHNSPRAPEYVFTAGIPVLGICYGMQTMAIQLGGYVENSTQREFGYAQLQITAYSKIFYNIKNYFTQTGTTPLLDVWMSHNDQVTVMPDGFLAIASTKNCCYAVIANEEKKFYGVQFHPEVTHTDQGQRIIENFILNICGCKTLWSPAGIIEDTIIKLRRQIGTDNVILGLSGGIDSSVTALLLHRAIGKRLTCIFIDNGLLRINENEQVIEIFEKKLGLNIIYVQAAEHFITALTGITDPEEKRKTIGCMFIKVFETEACKIPNVKWLAQGTIYPDIIESTASKNNTSQVIKSHHNVGGLPKKMKLGLIEPLKDLFKDEVLKLYMVLGKPYELQYRHPFPGPGLGVRIIGEVKKEYCDLLRRADAIFIEELYKANLYHKISQAFTVFLPVRSVGVMGDTRQYDWVVSLRAIETIDFMTAHWAHLPYDFLSYVSNRIINEVNGISRVVYDISSKPPATIEWE
ncbi:GMP synthase [glutamine-hydrolyzing] [Candidatus Profftia lariciata]|uniref:glutamine-hydrolyzing GMP synthase n=1 Tax=Candidatus Profftia lariciata TaxID=1987921 RepID=UPI001D00CA15|nr:glutamine-hydrolyzing GMP synthase [Candidatus Profftia lariciata]UDG81304.1 GMP synthase [glutamine-hydrolyzing] [Candidatus Profftia lariciata]